MPKFYNNIRFWEIPSLWVNINSFAILCLLFPISGKELLFFKLATTWDLNLGLLFLQPADDDKCCVLLTCAGDADEDDPEGPCKGIKVRTFKAGVR